MSEHAHLWRLDGGCDYIGCGAVRADTPEQSTVADPPTIDPADVKVGDVVEVEADDGSWLVRGEIDFIYNDSNDWPLLIKAQMFADNYLRPNLENATVRLVRRPEPEPDPEQVEALAEVMRSLPPISYDSSEDYARDLVRRGVTVRKEH